MADITSLELRLESLKKAYHSGVLTVRHGETTTTYRTLAEMESIIQSLESEISVLNGGERPRRIRYVRQLDKGL